MAPAKAQRGVGSRPLLFFERERDRGEKIGERRGGRAATTHETIYHTNLILSTLSFVCLTSYMNWRRLSFVFPFFTSLPLPLLFLCLCLPVSLSPWLCQNIVTQFCFLTICPFYFLSVCYGSRHSLGSLTLAFVLALSSSSSGRVWLSDCLAGSRRPVTVPVPASSFCNL